MPHSNECLCKQLLFSRSGKIDNVCIVSLTWLVIVKGINWMVKYSTVRWFGHMESERELGVEKSMSMVKAMDVRGKLLWSRRTAFCNTWEINGVEVWEKLNVQFYKHKQI